MKKIVDPDKEGFIFDGLYVNKKEYDYIFSYPESLSSDEELMIKQIYLDSLPKNEFYSYTIDNIDFSYYFGNYDGVYVVNINNQRSWCDMTHVHEHYAHFTFQCNWHTVMVIKDGEIYNI